MGLNNIDTKQVTDYKKEIQTDPNEAKFTAKIEGDWLFDEGGPQFRSTVKVKDGTYTMEASHPNFAGPACRPGPMAFGLFWFAACYSSTFVTEAAMRNLKLTSVKTRVEADLNYTVQFDLGNDPLISEYRVFMDVQGDATDAQVQDLKEYALKRCMGMFTIRNAIALKAEVRFQK
ncbi:OsmC family protein [Methanoregula formicica]|uniref:Putative redox protein, regulator of disulfide bond formation n=1 Tax=Methanoregula formicica (strain DSM 22288 / NBRC 105244 / SMSP) TaxID=593750 RepID=L0HCI9_METFS|nr:OsmC family protein [Methanoregula formicica]AGB01720.1 putative redox protein, regulator of disulfide bond formation [Methanoregula formicica SMSP]